jgi:hypothetical protein
MRRFAVAASERDADQDVHIDHKKDENPALVARSVARPSPSSGGTPRVSMVVSSRGRESPQP